MARAFGPYSLEARLGRGGMAETWRARWVGSVGVVKQVAIKRILPGFTDDPQFIAMFVSEAKLVATLSHGNIAQVFDVGQVDGEYYIAMEYVDGPSLKAMLEKAKEKKQPRVPLPLALYIVTELCKALHSAHTARDESGQPLRIVHRDISPENIMVSWQGQLKVIDFGIARSAMAERPQTEAGIMKGKVMYMSPEQARATTVDALTDVWAAGVVLFELLCGEPPVASTSYEGLMALWRGEGRRASQVNPAVPSEVDQIVSKALAVSRTDRLPSAQHLHDALADILHRDWPGVSQAWVSAYLTELYAEVLKQENRVIDVPMSARAALRSAMAGKTDSTRQRIHSKPEVALVPLEDAAPPTEAGGAMPTPQYPKRTTSEATARVSASTLRPVHDLAQDETAVDMPLVPPPRSVKLNRLDGAVTELEIERGDATARKGAPGAAVATPEPSEETAAVVLTPGDEEGSTDSHAAALTDSRVDLAYLNPRQPKRAVSAGPQPPAGLTPEQRSLLVKVAVALGALLLLAIAFALVAFKES